ncbi:TPA: RNA 2',3'-cyclic phosphodiesterase, partial [Thermoplasmata archaeon]|nr:RNA 2',3'-cyclic phosphodiesterase [Thermoplasmata archaeon]
MKFRAFISADISPSDSLVSLLEQLRRSTGDLKVVRAANLHVTLKFLGDTDESLIGDITDGIRTSSRGVGPFKLKLQGMGAF